MFFDYVHVIIFNSGKETEQLRQFRRMYTLPFLYRSFLVLSANAATYMDHKMTTGAGCGKKPVMP